MRNLKVLCQSKATNDTFESVFFKSVEIESVVVSAHPLCILNKNFVLHKYGFFHEH